MSSRQYHDEDVDIPIDGVTLPGNLVAPPRPQGLVIFAHGSGSSRHSPRNQFVAGALQRANLATLLFDLLTPEEERVDAATRHLRFDIDLLALRLGIATDWIGRARRVRELPVGYFGASTGAAAALRAAADRPTVVQAVVSRGGRPDLAGDALTRVRAPTLFIVGGSDTTVIEVNEQALLRLAGPKEIAIVPHATHLFEEAGALEEVARLASEWFVRYLEDPRS